MTVVVGYLPKPEGEAAFGAALEEAARRREDLVVLNSPRSGARVSADVAAPDVVVDLTTRAAAAGVAVDVRQAPHTGEFSDLLLGVADQVDASVIVIGLRRRTLVGKFLLGSNAQQILVTADRPVLAVKPHETR
jgi:nucleotide-binding universal stress UspA family protein